MSLGYYERLEMVFARHADEVQKGLAKLPMNYVKLPGIGTLYFFPKSTYLPNSQWFEVAPEGAISSDDHIQVCDKNDCPQSPGERQAVEDFLTAIGV